MDNLLVAYLAMGLVAAGINFRIKDKGWEYAPITAAIIWPIFLLIVGLAITVKCFPRLEREKSEQYWWGKP